MDLLTAVGAAINLAYFCYRLSAHPPATASHRAAAAVLAVVSFGAVVEAASLVVLSSRGSPVDSPEWALVRGLVLTGTLGMAALVLRRALSA